MKNRNLFIQLNLPEEKGIQQTLVNSWTRPLPMEFHLLHSPTLTHQLADLAPYENSTSIFDQNDQVQRCLVKKKGKERLKYIRLEEQLHFLEQFLRQFRDLHESQLLLYKQTLLVRYLDKFLEEIKIQCHEKGHFLKSIWNALIKIFQQLFERVVSESKRKEKEMLTGQIQLHQQYQRKLEELKQSNQTLVVTETKYKGAISQLMDSVAIVNMELKGTKSLQEKSATTVKQLSLKYEELRADYLDIVVSTGVTRAEAEAHLYDRQMLIFSKQISKKEAEVKVNAKVGRKARIINENIDVGLILEEIEAEEQYDFEIECEEREEDVTYGNQRVQTQPIEPQGKNVEIQSNYFDLIELKIIRDKAIQTGKQDPIVFVNEKVQTDYDTSRQRKTFGLFRQYSLTISEKIEQVQEVLTSAKLLKLTNVTEPSQNTFAGLDDEPNKDEEPVPTVSFHMRESVTSAVDKSRLRKTRQSKMFRVGDASRASKLFPQKRLQTEGGRESEMSNSIAKRTSETKKISQLILLQQIRKNTLGKWNKFRSMSVKYNFFTQIKEQFSNHLGKDTKTFIVQIQNSIFGRTNSFIQNVQLYRVNQHLCRKIYVGLSAKKGFIAGKTMRIVADILHNYQNFIKEGIYSLNLASYAMEYLAALKGQYLEAQAKQKIFLQFIRSCLPLSVSSYLVKNFFLLCGFPLNRTDREHQMSKLSLKVKQQQRNQESLIRYMYSSQVYAYFHLLSKANCDSSLDLLQAYTNAHVLLDSLEELKLLYKNSDRLIQTLQEVVKKTIEATGESDPKFDIYKVLQVVLQRILSFKQKIAEGLEPLAVLYGELDDDFFSSILSLLTHNPQQLLIALRLQRVCYGGLSSLENISSLIIIEGYQLDILPFLKIENQYKYSIMKRVICESKVENKMMNSMIQAIVRKQLKKAEFLCLLKMMWTKQAEVLCQSVMGENLLTLYQIGVSQTLEQPKKANFHSASFGFSQS